MPPFTSRAWAKEGGTLRKRAGGSPLPDGNGKKAKGGQPSHAPRIKMGGAEDVRKGESALRASPKNWRKEGKREDKKRSLF